VDVGIHKALTGLDSGLDTGTEAGGEGGIHLMRSGMLVGEQSGVRGLGESSILFRISGFEMP
jgi:hypothetical protein